MKIRLAVIVGSMLFITASCSNVYTKVDSAPSGEEEHFLGLRQYLLHDAAELHVLQTHGMGDHPYKAYCAEGSQNIELQREVVKRIGFVSLNADTAIQEVPIILGRTRVGAYSTRVYGDRADNPRRLMYFSCLTWGDASREVKVKMLDLSPSTFYENGQNEKHRALINRQAKRFVNRSFSDPVIYLGSFGQYIRQGVWAGIEGINFSQEDNRAKFLFQEDGSAETVRHSLSDIPMVVISDSLGSKVLFDVLCSNGAACGSTSVSRESDIGADSDQRMKLAESTRRSIRGVFMFANQLPLLELSSVEPPPMNVSLDEWLENQPCHASLSGLGLNALSNERSNKSTIVAFTDVNDALSYHLDAKFKERCSPDSSSLRIVNVTIPNAKIRYFGIYSNLGKAHASGFKTNKRAIGYLVDGN